MNINELRAELLGTLKDLRNREQPMEPDRARAIAQVASVMVDTARVEVDFLRVTNKDRSEFLQPETTRVEGPNPVRVVTHRIKA